MSTPFDLDHRPQVGKAVTLAPDIAVVTAPNASPMTFTGTQTYLLGRDAVAIIDPGPDDDAHLQALLAALKGRPLSHILLTHTHVDHSPLSRRLAECTGAPILAFGDAQAARSPIMEKLSRAADLGGGEGIDTGFRCDQLIADGQIIQGDGWELEAIHTPGHLSNHLCFALNDRNAVFSGDHVMGWATTMVSPPDGDLTRFMTSLKRLAQRGDDRVYYPGHGAALPDPLEMVAYLLRHRKSRESQILEALAKGSSNAAVIATMVYTDVDPRLIPAATRNVLAHLIDLTERDIVFSQTDISRDSVFALK